MIELHYYCRIACLSLLSLYPTALSLSLFLFFYCLIVYKMSITFDILLRFAITLYIYTPVYHGGLLIDYIKVVPTGLSLFTNSFFSFLFWQHIIYTYKYISRCYTTLEQTIFIKYVLYSFIRNLVSTIIHKQCHIYIHTADK